MRLSVVLVAMVFAGSSWSEVGIARVFAARFEAVVESFEQGPPRRGGLREFVEEAVAGRRDVLGAAAPRGGVLRSARGGLRPAGPRRRPGDEDGGLGAHPALIEQYPDVPHAPAHALDVGARAAASSRRRKIIECEAPSIIQVIYFAGGG